MKYKQGFVSNSSTTSFIIGVLKGIDERDKIFLDLAETILSGWDDKNQCSKTDMNNINDYMDALKEEIKELKKDNKFIDDKINKIRSILKNDDILNALDLYISTPDIDIRNSRMRKEYNSNKKTKDIFDIEVSSLTYKINKNNEKIADINKKINKIESIPDYKEIDYIFSFVIDNMNSSMIINQIELLEKSGVVIIIERVHS